MSNIWLKLIVIFTISVLSVGAVQSNDGCSARLVTHRYYGPFRALLLAGKLTPKHLAEALRSDTPYNPFPHGHVPVELISASDYFADVVKEPEVIAGWKNTQAALAPLEEEIRKQEVMSEGARQATEHVLAPQIINHIRGALSAPAWTALADGSVRVASIQKNANDDGQTLVVTTPEGGFKFTAKAPENFEAWQISWYHHTDGSVWIYALGVTPFMSKRQDVVYALRWGVDTDLHKLKLEGLQLMEKPKNLYNVGPGFMLLTTTASDKQMFNLAESPRLTFVGNFTGGQSAAVTQNGKLAIQRFSLQERHQEAFFTAPSKRLLNAMTMSSKFLIQEVRVRSDWQEMEMEDLKSDQIVLFEAPNEEIYAGLIQIVNDKTKRLSVFRPSASKQAVYWFDFSADSWAKPLGQHALHFFPGLHGHVYLGFTNDGSVFIHDIQDKSEILSIPFGETFNGWFDHQGQTYFSSSDGGGTIPLYEFFRKSKDAP